jgi:DNA modification methylase
VRCRLRRALTQVGGPVEVWADKCDVGQLLVAALEVGSDESTVMKHVHGFHTYPARMHPDTAARLVRGLSLPNQVVLDPFAGSGTVLVEARLQGRVALGIDANPLAVALCRLKVDGIDPAQREVLLAAIAAVTEHASERRRSKAGPSRRYSPAHRAAFEPHILLELDGLTQGIDELCPPEIGPALRLVLSSLINKFSRRRSDTNGFDTRRRLAGGFAIGFFANKARELLGRLDDYARQLPPRCTPAKVELGDARELPLPGATISSIITSPPYPGIYDYLEHHRLRLEWLKLDIKHLERHEIGAHRHFAARGGPNLQREWAAQLGACLDEMCRVLVPDGTAAILIGDSVVAGQAWYADRALQELAGLHGLEVVAGASQHRGHFHGPTQDAFRLAQRREHLIVLRRQEPHLRSSIGASRPNPHASHGQQSGHAQKGAHTEQEGHARGADPVVGPSHARKHPSRGKKPPHRLKRSHKPS